MEPEIRFCTSADGTRIAYSTGGEPAGPALVLVKNHDRTQQFWWKYPESLADALASRAGLITFDQRGVGDSQRDVDDLAIPAQVADIATVVDQLGLESFDLIGQAQGGALAAAYTAEYPKRVGRLVLLRPYAMRTSDSPLQGLQDMVQSIRANWSFARRSMATLAFPNGPTDLQRSYSKMLRDSLTPDIAARHLEALAEFDGETVLGNVQVPTLVLANVDAHARETASIRAIASLIPDARFLTYELGGRPQTEDQRELLSMILSFLYGADADLPIAAAQGATGGFATILLTDMEGSTTLADRLGDNKAQEVRRAHNEIVRAALTANSGSEIKHTGDGIMASFATASSALDAAIAIQRGVAAHKEEQPDSPLGVYVGLNAGEPIAEDDDLFGTSINLAARICDHAEAGQILAANVVRELAAGKDFMFSDLGETELRGFEDPVKLWELRWQAG